METTHKSIFSDSSHLKELTDESVDLVVTSPPYPMIEMWDEIFSLQSSSVKKMLSKGDGNGAFEAMHKILDATWAEVFRVLKPGGFACINIGDATRTINDNFSLYANHARILNFAHKLGFFCLPCILWRKQTNAPNKFMGSGMLPAGAYVTLEHEYILILRKGTKRKFEKETDKQNRRASAFFWEERNLWFSDIWLDIKGVPQSLSDKDTRKRSAAYPFELVYRLINMYSVKGDLILDPFLGTGTTTLAAMASARNSIGYEIDSGFQKANLKTVNTIIEISGLIIRQRLVKHLEFVSEQLRSGRELKHINLSYGFPVMTAQEKELLLDEPLKLKSVQGNISTVEYAGAPQPEFTKDWTKIFNTKEEKIGVEKLKEQMTTPNFKQKLLF